MRVGCNEEQKKKSFGECGDGSGDKIRSGRTGPLHQEIVTVSNSLPTSAGCTPPIRSNSSLTAPTSSLSSSPLLLIPLCRDRGLTSHSTLQDPGRSEEKATPGGRNTNVTANPTPLLSHALLHRWVQPHAAAPMDPLTRTTSAESTRSRSSHPLTASTSPTLLGNHKARTAEPDTTSDVARASISMPPPASRSVARQFSHSRKPSKASDSAILDVGTPASSIDHKLLNGSAVDDADLTPTLEGSQSEIANSLTYPDSVVAGQPKGDTDVESNRMSFSSLYSLGSAIHNSTLGRSGPSSVAGSELEG